jgi:hypothetical protein
MTPDELIAEIFRIQEERNPDEDPGDITIDVQDDMPLVMVSQTISSSAEAAAYDNGMKFSDFMMLAQGTPGGSIQDALENFLEEVKEGKR